MTSNIIHDFVTEKLRTQLSADTSASAEPSIEEMTIIEDIEIPKSKKIKKRIYESINIIRKDR